MEWKKRNNYQINFIELDGDKNDSEIDNFEAEYLILQVKI